MSLISHKALCLQSINEDSGANVLDGMDSRIVAFLLGVGVHLASFVKHFFPSIKNTIYIDVNVNGMLSSFSFRSVFCEMNTEPLSTMASSPISSPPTSPKSETELQQDSSLALVSVRSPTPEKCAVCLNNKQNDIIARIDSCSHTFCFSCILEWSKVRAICPLCKQAFNVITRERFSGDIVEEIRVQAPRPASSTRFTSLNDVLSWVDQHQRRRDHQQSNELFRQMVYVDWLNTVQALVRRPK